MRFGSSLAIAAVGISLTAASCPPAPPPCIVPTEHEAAGSAGTGILVAARMAAHECGDRLVFEFASAGQVPAYHINYVSDPLYATSGEMIYLDGAATLSVVLHGAAHDDNGNPTYTGSHHLVSDTHNITEAVFIEDFEGIVQWGVGLDSERAFVVSTLSSPARLVIDFAP